MLEKMGGQSLKGIRGIGETKDNSDALHMIEEVAEAVAFLAQAAYITGQVLSVDGGMAM